MCKTPLSRLAAATLLATGLLFGAAQAAVPTTVDYSARLFSSTTSAPVVSTDVDVTIRVYNDATATDAANLLETFTFNAVDLSGTNGYLSVELDLDGVDLSGDVYLEVEIEDNNASLGAEILSPRQKVNSVPFALSAASADAVSATASQSILAQAILDAADYTDDVTANLGRVLLVNPASTATTPDGTLSAPFTTINDAYAHAKTISGAGSFFNRIAIVLTPGQHVLSGTLELDTVGIDIVGLVDSAAFIQGTANPLVRFTAPTSGAWVRNVRFAPTGVSNVAVEATAGGRLIGVAFTRPGNPGGTLLSINSTEGFSVRGFEVYGDVSIAGFGVGANTTFTDGFVTGTVAVTGNSTAQEFVSFVNCSGIGAISFNPANPGFGILALSNVPLVGSLSYNASRTVLQMNSVGFPTPPGLAQPLPGSTVANSVASTASWSGIGVFPSSGNVAGVYTAFITIVP